MSPKKKRGPGRPALPPRERKQKTSVGLTADELDLIKAGADALGVSVSDFIVRGACAFARRYSTRHGAAS